MHKFKTASQVALVVKNPPANAGDVRDVSLIPELGRSPGEGNGYPLKYSVLENSMDCIVHGVTKSRTRLSDFHVHISISSADTSLTYPLIHSFSV